MEHMHRTKIYIPYHQSKSLEVAALRFVQDMHPRITFRDPFSHNLGVAIHFEMTVNEKIKIKISSTGS